MSDDVMVNAAEGAAAREARLRRLEDELKKLQPKRKDFWEKLQASSSLSSLISALLVVIVGYYLTGSVNNAIQRQQLQLSNVKEMRDLLAELDTADINQANAAAFTLSAFGRPAVPALMAALLSGGDVRAPAAERALRAIGLNDSEAVCGPARKVLDNRSGRFTWLAHLAAIRLLGDLECRGARVSVEAYAQALGQVRSPADVSAFAPRYSADLQVDGDAVGQLRTETERTLTILRP